MYIYCLSQETSPVSRSKPTGDGEGKEKGGDKGGRKTGGEKIFIKDLKEIASLRPGKSVAFKHSIHLVSRRKIVLSQSPPLGGGGLDIFQDTKL